MTADRMFLLRFGTELIPKWVSVPGGGQQTLQEPVFGALVETRDGLVLLDTGIGRRALDDPAVLQAVYGPGRSPRAPDGDPLLRVLDDLGFALEDIALAAVSHLHLDHSGGIPLLARAGTPVAIQAAELDYGRHRAAEGTELDAAYHRADYVDVPADWRRLDGWTELAPGVTAIPTPGHTPGHQSFRVELPGTGTWVLAADAADLAQNLHERVHCGWTAEPDDVRQAEASLHVLLDLADRTAARVLPGHDPVVWTAAWHPPGGHR